MTMSKTRVTAEPALVSIVMPTYNRASYIGEAIESIRAQTYPHWNLHIVDDGSADNTAAVIEPYLSDARVRYKYQSNAGQSAARNRAISDAEGKYVAFLDSDNAWVPDKLEFQINAAEANEDFHVFYGETVVVSNDGTPLNTAKVRRWSGFVTEQLLQGNFVNFNTSLVRREMLVASDGFDVDLRSGEDFDLWLRLSMTCRFHFSPRVLARYRVTPGQISSDVWKNLNANRAILDRFIAANSPKLRPRSIRKAWSKFFTRCGRAHASQGNAREAFREYRRALMHEPAGLHVWRSILALALRRH